MRTTRAAVALTAAAWLAVAAPAAAEAPPPIDPPVDPATARSFPAADLRLTAEQLRFTESNLDGSVLVDGDEITLAADVFFAYNSATLSADARRALRPVIERLRGAAAAGLRVTGHTDSRGSDRYNRGLSLRRARAVRAALRAALGEGIPVAAVGRGETQPRADNDSARGRALNRRVTITITG